MSESTRKNRTGREVLKALRTSVARFYPCDLHVHSPGSYDVCQSGRIEQLPADLRAAVDQAAAAAGIQLPLAKAPLDAEAFDKAMATPALVEIFLEQLLRRRDSIVQTEALSETDNWCLVAITDHNTSNFACALAAAAWRTKATHHIVVTPGIELDISFDVPGLASKCQVHVLCLFAPQTTPSDMRIAINDARPPAKPTWSMGNPIEVDELAPFIEALRNHASYPAICIAAHVWSKKGVQNEPSKMMLAHLDAEIARLEGELSRATADGSTMDVADIRQRLDAVKLQQQDGDAIHLEVLRMIGTCGFDALQVRDQSHETHYRRLHRFREKHGRGVPVVSSDAHAPDRVFQCSSGIPFAKISASLLNAGAPSEFFSELRDRVLRFGETRTTYATPGAVSYWIEGIEIVRDAQEASAFWNSAAAAGPPAEPFTLELSRNLNCFVGGRGSGKSACIEAIAFLTAPEPFAAQGRSREHEDWYLRAKATLAGCRIRLVWKTTADEGIGTLPKKALFLSRYFDPQGVHQAVEMRDADDKAIVDSAVKPPRVRILRVHEIEETARQENLRRLFDDLCGPRIEELTADIEAIRGQLQQQRVRIMKVVTALAPLSLDGSPLRQYGIRKQQFDEVNKPELQSRFQDVDQAAEASLVSAKTATAWDEIELVASLEGLAQESEAFFTAAHDAIPQANGAAAEPHKQLADLLKPSGVPSAGELPDAPRNEREVVMTSLRAAKDSATGFGQKLLAVQSAAQALHVAKTDALAKDGLPAGSSERSAKKRAFEEAKTALEQYEAGLSQLVQLLAERQTLHQALIDAGKERSSLRESRAATISSQLARDLDATILQIVLVAKPMHDQGELEAWLEHNVGPTIQKFKSQRLKALLQAGIMPAVLRELLLHDGDPDVSILKNARQRADDGKIDEEAALQIFNRCRGKRRVALDEADTWTPEFQDALPESIRSGVIAFPTVEKSSDSCIDRILQLDEVVLDDAAEVRLNDRPSDPQSETRPLDELSPGQRCSAILPILLLSGDYPLVIDQPEENLDNRLIRQVIVNILASMKLSRQVIIATHNPNLPVLGDAEQCVVLQAKGRNLSEVVATGNLDSPSIARFITDIMEGGREAFQYRQSIYQHHWQGPVEAGGT